MFDKLSPSTPGVLLSDSVAAGLVRTLVAADWDLETLYNVYLESGADGKCS